MFRLQASCQNLSKAEIPTTLYETKRLVPRNLRGSDVEGFHERDSNEPVMKVTIFTGF